MEWCTLFLNCSLHKTNNGKMIKSELFYSLLTMRTKSNVYTNSKTFHRMIWLKTESEIEKRTDSKHLLARLMVLQSWHIDATCLTLKMFVHRSLIKELPVSRNTMRTQISDLQNWINIRLHVPLHQIGQLKPL